MKYHTIYKEVEIDVELSDFEDDELIQELEDRGVMYEDFGDSKLLLESIWQKRRIGEDYQRELEKLIYMALGKVI